MLEEKEILDSFVKISIIITNNFEKQSTLRIQESDMEKLQNLKEAEKKAFQLSTNQDGLYDTFIGIFIISISVMPWLDENGMHMPWNLILVEGIAFALLLGVIAIKKWVVAPRIGQVKFGEARKSRMKRLAIGMGVIFIITVILFGLTVRAIYFADPIIDEPIQSNFPIDIVHTTAGIFIFVLFSSIAYVNDYPRMYVYGLLFGLGYIISTALQDITGNPFYWPQALAGLGAVISGLVIFRSFLQKYPRPSQTEAG